mmetsp:Transcript_2603/g.4577  ORF Transcript_2603/g.4577 Transcript_2603/m.4577 type:complete len:392 (+) Transcript_2603:30-1205(+)
MEINSLRRLSHKNVVSLLAGYYDASVPQQPSLSRVVLCFERALCTLQDFAAYSLNEALRLRLFEDMLCGLQHCQDRCVLHRDVKPANVLVFVESTGAFHAKLADFGSSSCVALSLSGASGCVKRQYLPSSVVTTYMVAAPEVLFDQTYYFASDVWSSAITWHYLCHRSFPFLLPRQPSPLVHDAAACRSHEITCGKALELLFQQKELPFLDKQLLKWNVQSRPLAVDCLHVLHSLPASPQQAVTETKPGPDTLAVHAQVSEPNLGLPLADASDKCPEPVDLDFMSEHLGSPDPCASSCKRRRLRAKTHVADANFSWHVRWLADGKALWKLRQRWALEGRVESVSLLSCEGRVALLCVHLFSRASWRDACAALDVPDTAHLLACTCPAQDVD